MLAARDAARLSEAVEEISGAGGRAESVSIDVADRSSVQAATARVLETHGRIDGLVNSAGVTRDNLVLRMKDEDWQAPGFIDTDMTANMTDKAKEAVTAAIPIGRVGRPEDISGAVTYLVSDAAAYVTGQVLGVDGGFRM